MVIFQEILGTVVEVKLPDSDNMTILTVLLGSF